MQRGALAPACQARLDAGLEQLGLADLDAATRAALLRHVELLQQWNAAYNLTAVREPLEMVARHLLDSLAVLPFVRGERLVDVGCGPGLPGIPLLLAGACSSALLVDSNGKMIRFCRHAVAELGLAARAEARQARIEAVPASDGGDVVIARAFASLADFVRSAGHLVRPDGRLLAMKGRLAADELAALPDGWVLRATHGLAVPGVEGERHLLELQRRG